MHNKGSANHIDYRGRLLHVFQQSTKYLQIRIDLIYLESGLLLLKLLSSAIVFHLATSLYILIPNGYIILVNNKSLLASKSNSEALLQAQSTIKQNIQINTLGHIQME
jgi:hypothetical protein